MCLLTPRNDWLKWKTFVKHALNLLEVQREIDMEIWVYVSYIKCSEAILWKIMSEIRYTTTCIWDLCQFQRTAECQYDIFIDIMP